MKNSLICEKFELDLKNLNKDSLEMGVQLDNTKKDIYNNKLSVLVQKQNQFINVNKVLK